MIVFPDCTVYQRLAAWPGLEIRFVPPEGKEYQAGQCWVRFRVLVKEHDRYWDAINAVMGEYGIRSYGQGLASMCSDYFSAAGPYCPAPQSGKRRWTSFLPLYAIHLEDLLEALDLARERSGYEDAGTAIVAIAREYGNRPEAVRNGTSGHNGQLDVKGWQANAEPARLPAGTPPRTPAPRDPQTRKEDRSLPSRGGAIPSPHGWQRRVGHHPGHAGEDGDAATRKERAQGPSPRQGAAGAISPRGGSNERFRAIGSDPLLYALDPPRRLACATVAALADRVEVDEAVLRWAAEHSQGHYELKWIRQPSGKWREVFAPDDELLKPIQERLCDFVLADLVDSPIAYGVGPLTHIDAARCHAQQPFVGTFDIHRFFRSVQEPLLRALFTGLGFGPEAVDLLIGLVTYERCLPPGAPTSPVIANLLLGGSDWRLDAHAARLGVTLTRYVDDYASSGSDRTAIEEMERLIDLKVRRLGLKLSPAKCVIRARNQPQVVLGLNVNNGVAIPKVYREAVRRGVYRLASQAEILDTRFHRAVGQVNYVRELHPNLAGKLAAVLDGVRDRVVPDPNRRRRKRRARGAISDRLRAYAVLDADVSIGGQLVLARDPRRSAA